MAVFKPTGTLHRVTDITPELLGAMHIRALVLDVDNTMAPHGDQTPYTGVLEWTKRMTAAGVRLVVGDQIVTDILGANLCGMPSVLLDPIARDPAATVRFKRWLEHFLRPHYKRLDSKIRSPEI